MALPELKYNDAGLIPCIVQDATTREVLMMAWMSEESLGMTLACGETVFWSRSRQELWHKGGHQRKHAEGGGAALRLRRRLPAGAGESRRSCLPYWCHQLFLPHARGLGFSCAAFCGEIA